MSSQIKQRRSKETARTHLMSIGPCCPPPPSTCAKPPSCVGLPLPNPGATPSPPPNAPVPGRPIPHPAPPKPLPSDVFCTFWTRFGWRGCAAKAFMFIGRMVFGAAVVVLPSSKLSLAKFGSNHSRNSSFWYRAFLRRPGVDMLSDGWNCKMSELQGVGVRGIYEECALVCISQSCLRQGMVPWSRHKHSWTKRQHLPDRVLIIHCSLQLSLLTLQLPCMYVGVSDRDMEFGCFWRC